MKPKSALRSFLVIAGSSMLAVSLAHAQNTYYWDSNSTTAGFGNTAGTWGTSSFLNTDPGGAGAGPLTLGPTSSLDTLNFGTATLNYANASVGVAAGGVSIGDIVFGAGQTTAITALGTAGQAITINNGITKNAGSAAVTFTSPITLGASQTWTNNSANKLQISSFVATSLGQTLILAGTGEINFPTTTTGITGGGSIIVDGAYLNQISGGTQALNSYTGTTTLQNGGSIMYFSNNIGNPSGTSGNITLNGGWINGYANAGFTREFGAGNNQLQITGGTSGFGTNGSGTINFSNVSEVKWGTATFNPSVFVLGSANGANGGTTTFAEGIDLDGSDRTITTVSTNNNGAVSGVIRNTNASAAGLIKTGAGTLTLSTTGTNTYDGNTAVNQGTLTANTSGALPLFGTSGKVIVAGGATLAVRTAGWTPANIDSLRGAATWSATTSRLGFDTSGGSFTYASNITEALSVTKLGTNTLILTGNNTYTGITRINSATLQAGSATALGNGGDITFGGGTLQYTTASAATDFGSRINTGASTILLDTNGQNVGISGIANTNTGGLTKSGAGILTLTGTNSYTGATTVNGGSLVVNGGTISNSSVVLGTGGSMSITNGGTVNSPGSAGAFVSNTTMTVTGGNGVTSTWNLGNGDLGSVSNNYSNAQMLIDGAGYAGSAVVTNVKILNWGRTLANSTLTLTNGGQMNVNGETRIGNPYYSETGGTNLTIGGGTATSTFTGNTGQDFYIGYGERTGSKNNVVTVSAGGVLTSIRDMYVGHVRDVQNNDNDSTANKLMVTGGTASMRQLSLGFADADTRDANANVVEVTNGGTLSTTGTIYIGRADNPTTESNANTMTVTGTGSTWNAGNQNVLVGFTNNASAQSNNNILTVGTGGVVSNVAALTVGSGTAGSTKTGNQLVVNGSLTATGVTVNAANSLSGIGTITGPVTVNGTLTPGNSSIGTLAVGNLAFGATGIYSVGLDASSVTSDQATATGTVALNATTTLTPNVTGTLAAGQRYFIVVNDDVDAITGTFATLAQDAVVGTYGSIDLKISYTGDSVGNAIAGGNDIVLYVEGGVANPYETWAGPGVAFGDDANKDGVENGLAFLLGAANPNANALGLLPTVDESGGGLVLTFSMLNAASRGTATVSLEHSGDLGLADAWTTVPVPDATPGSPVSGVTFTVTPGSPKSSVTATISSSEALSGKLFGRLKGSP